MAMLFMWFIPAYVGNTLLGAVIVSALPVHPRVCGEHNSNPRRWCVCGGSSPRMWGTLLKKYR